MSMTNVSECCGATHKCQLGRQKTTNTNRETSASGCDPSRIPCSVNANMAAKTGVAAPIAWFMDTARNLSDTFAVSTAIANTRDNANIFVS
jgi:hypothetical protein